MSDHNHDSDYTAPPIEANYAPLRRAAFLAAVFGGIAFAALAIANISMNGDAGVRDLFLAYQSGFLFWMLIPVGSMALMLLGYLTHASWALVLRRVFQASTKTWMLVFLLFLPVVLSVFMQHKSSFWWAVDAAEFAKEHANGDPVVVEEVAKRQKLILNPPFFLLRAGLLFGVFGLLIRAMRKWAPAAEDEGNFANKEKLRKLAGPGVVLWALLFTMVSATDWIMSVEPSWASSMFPIVLGMDTFMTTMAFSAFVLYFLTGENSTAMSIIKDKFRIDVGSLTFGFTMVWAYASFSQYMLIWAGNMPEEIGYYRKRLNGGWEFAAYALMIVHWLLPFVLFLFREIKTSPRAMQWMAVMLMSICVMDVIWWIVPCVPHQGDYQFFHLPMALAAVAMVGGIWGLAFLGQLRKANLLPKKDTAFLATWGHH